MNWKRLRIGFALIFFIIILSACSSEEGTTPFTNPTENSDSTSATENQDAASSDELKPEPNARLIIWEDRSERVFTDEIAKQFTRKYGVPVQIEEVAPPDQVTKLQTDGPSGLGGDVVVFPHDHLGRAASANLVLPNDIFAETTLTNNKAAAIHGVTFDGMLYGYPRSAETYVLYYNKTLVENPPETFEDVIQFSKSFTDTDDNRYGIMWSVNQLYFDYPFIASLGGYVFGQNGTDPSDIGLNHEGAVKGMQTFVDLKQVLPVKAGDLTGDIIDSLFTTGDAAMVINGPWALANYRKALGENLGVAPIPQVGGKPAISFSGIKAWYVNAYTKYPNAAKLFARFASSKAAQLMLYKKVGSVPTHKEALNDPQIVNDPLVSEFARQTAHSQPMPSIPEMGNVWGPMTAALNEIWDNGLDPKSALDQAVKQIQDLNNGVTGE